MKRLLLIVTLLAVNGCVVAKGPAAYITFTFNPPDEYQNITVTFKSFYQLEAAFPYREGGPNLFIGQKIHNFILSAGQTSPEIKVPDFGLYGAHYEYNLPHEHSFEAHTSIGVRPGERNQSFELFFPKEDIDEEMRLWSFEQPSETGSIAGSEAGAGELEAASEGEAIAEGEEPWVTAELLPPSAYVEAPFVEAEEELPGATSSSQF